MRRERVVVSGNQAGKTTRARKGLSSVQVAKVPSISGQLDVEQVVRLLEVGAACRVKVLRLRDLCVIFGVENTVSVAGRPTPENSSHPKVRSEEELERVKRAGRVGERADLVSDELEHLKITDPAAYEEFIQSEDVDDGGSGP